MFSTFKMFLFFLEVRCLIGHWITGEIRVKEMSWFWCSFLLWSQIRSHVKPEGTCPGNASPAFMQAANNKSTELLLHYTQNLSPAWAAKYTNPTFAWCWYHYYGYERRNGPGSRLDSVFHLHNNDNLFLLNALTLNLVCQDTSRARQFRIAPNRLLVPLRNRVLT